MRIFNNPLNQKYRDGLDYLDQHYAFFLTKVLNIGNPHWTPQIPTAAVGFDPEKETPTDFRLMFNGDFALKLSESEMGFVQAHETFHIVLDHLTLFQDKKKFSNPKIANVAADCVINDYLYNMGLDVPEWVCRGEKIVGYDCANATVTQVYADIKQQMDDAACDACGGDGEKKDGGGNGTGEPCDSCGGTGIPGAEGQFDSHEWLHDPSEAVKKAAQKMAQQAGQQGGQDAIPQGLKDKADEDKGTAAQNGGLMAGTGIVSAAGFAELKGVSLNWVELLKEINPDVINTRPGQPPRPSYHTPRRKLAGMRQLNPDINLPVMTKRGNDKGELPSIVMALDTSGSIGDDDANRFVNLAKSIPQDKIHLFCCTFTSQYMPLDLDDPKWVSGGTSFGAIEDFIRREVVPSDAFKKTKNKDGYPNAVVVVTDGCASFPHTLTPEDKFKDRWFWLMTTMNYTSYITGSGFKQDAMKSLADFTKGTKMAKEMAGYR